MVGTKDRKDLHAIFLLVVSNLFGFVMGVIAYVQNNLPLFFADVAIFFLSSIALWGLLKYSHRRPLIRSISMVGTLVVTLVLFGIGGVDGTASLWCMSFPLVSNCILGHRKALFLSLFLIVSCLLLQIIARNVPDSFLCIYSINYLIRFVTVYLLILAVSIFTEMFRNVLQEKSTSYQRELTSVIKDLESTRVTLRQLTVIDPLTDVYNRRYLTTEADNLLLNSGKKYAVSLFCDIDDFKLYNDHYGHIAGDDVLGCFGNKVQDVTGRYDGVWARFGGEEFVFLFATDDSCDGSVAGDKIIKMLREEAMEHIYTSTGNVTVSIGISFCPMEEYDGWINLVGESDQAMYEAKKNGKNQYAVFTG